MPCGARQTGRMADAPAPLVTPDGRYLVVRGRLVHVVTFSLVLGIGDPGRSGFLLHGLILSFPCGGEARRGLLAGFPRRLGVLHTTSGMQL